MTFEEKITEYLDLIEKEGDLTASLDQTPFPVFLWEVAAYCPNAEIKTKAKGLLSLLDENGFDWSQKMGSYSMEDFSGFRDFILSARLDRETGGYITRSATEAGLPSKIKEKLGNALHKIGETFKNTKSAIGNIKRGQVMTASGFRANTDSETGDRIDPKDRVPEKGKDLDDGEAKRAAFYKSSSDDPATLNAQYQKLDSPMKRELFISYNLPDGSPAIQAQRPTLAKALMRYSEPFTSLLYKVIKAMASFISKEDILLLVNPRFDPLVKLLDHWGIAGLSQTDNKGRLTQLKVICFFALKNWKIKYLRTADRGKERWKSPRGMTAVVNQLDIVRRGDQNPETEPNWKAKPTSKEFMTYYKALTGEMPSKPITTAEDLANEISYLLVKSGDSDTSINPEKFTKKFINEFRPLSTWTDRTTLSTKVKDEMRRR